ncbi:MAG: transglutaminase family protein [Planctomycetota bacterium]
MPSSSPEAELRVAEEQQSREAGSVFRRKTAEKSAANLISARRRSGVIWMALISIVALLILRTNNDPWEIILVEFGTIGSLVAFGACFLQKLDRTLKGAIVGLLSCLIPWALDPFWRSFNYGNGTEILALCSLAWAGVALSIFANRPRVLGLSVVASGFLTLFTTFISDQQYAASISYLWGILCLWWLVANQWELVESCQASHISRTPLRWYGVVVGVAVFTLAVVISYNRIPILKKLEAGFMPSSGGSKWTDVAARSGVGSGDVLVAAKNHAMTFGAVDTDFFLDSPKQSLFDVFTEEFGEPSAKKEIGMAQALSSDDVRTEDGKFAEANRSSGSEFSTQRDSPRLKSKPSDLYSDALMFWKGAPGIRLAVDRYHDFDGVTWKKNESQLDSKPSKAVQVEDVTWFKEDKRVVRSSVGPFVGTASEALKFTRYRSTFVPTRLGLQLWSIDMLDRADFFEITKDDSMLMPRRSHVPDYTVIRFINSQTDLQRLEKLVANCAPGKPHLQTSDSCKDLIAEMAHEFAGNHERSWTQVSRMMAKLREKYQLDNSIAIDEDDPVAEFLQTGKGPSYMFATVGALMLEHMGYKTRLARGFYVSSRNYVEGEYAILNNNAHFWIELNVGHDYWVPLEPSPGYQQPRYHATLAYRMYQARFTILFFLIGLVVTGAFAFRFRFFLFEGVCRLGWLVASMLSDRKRLRWLVAVLDMRFSFAGQKRPVGLLLRKQIGSLGLDASKIGSDAKLLLNEADKLWYGGAKQLSPEGRQALKHLWLSLSVFEIRSNTLEKAELPTAV